MSDYFCPNCGAKVELSLSDACPNCGEKVSGSSGMSVSRRYSGEFRYAGFWTRFGAYIIDMLILVIPYLVIAAIFGESGASLLILLVAWVYFAYLESSEKQATFGKQALGLIVIDVDGNRLDFIKATIRYICKLIFGGLLLVGYIIIGFTEKKQGLHDMIVGTYVIQK
jgi:uncharacterized RDD family membrane protein YckC